jgi:hypothetical protein
MQKIYKPALLMLVFSFSLFTLCRAQAVIEWQNTIGGSDGDYLSSVQQTIDGGYILGGYSRQPFQAIKPRTPTERKITGSVKTDAGGNIQWQNTIGASGNDRLYSVQQTADGGYILGGYSESNISGEKTENCIGYW